MQEVAADVVSSVTHRRGGQAGSCGGRGIKCDTSKQRTGGQLRRTWPAHGLGKWEVPAGYKFSRQRGRRRR